VLLLQAAELQQYAAGQKAQQQELQALQQTAKRHEEAPSKAEVSTARALDCNPARVQHTGAQHFIVLGLHMSSQRGIACFSTRQAGISLQVLAHQQVMGASP
jgi:hypothetical protein